MSKVSGIYLITCRPKGRLPYYYVGQSSNIKARWAEHRTDLRTGRHGNKKLLNVVTKHGLESLTFEVLEECEPALLDALEQWWINEMHGYRRCLNISKHVDTPQRGIPVSEEAKAKISAANSGKKRTSEMKKRLSDATKGRVYPKAVYEKIGDALRGKKRPKEVGEKISKKLKGRKPSQACLEAITKSRKGKPCAPDVADRLRSLAASNARPVIATCLQTGDEIWFQSVAATASAGFIPQNVWQLLNVRGKSHKGHVFRYDSTR